MASTGFNSISQVAEILGKPEIDEKERHFILELLTKTLGENIHLKTSLDEKQDLCERHIANQALGDHEIELLENACESQVQIIRARDQTIESLGNQLREKEMMIRHDTKEIKKLRGELKEKEEEIESEEDSEEADSEEEEDSEEENSEEENSEEDTEEEPRRRYVAPTVSDPLVPVMENGEKKWYRLSECCGSYSWGGEELWVRNWM